MPTTQIVDHLISYILERHETKNDALKSIEKLLNISRSGLYGKLNGRTNFTFAEIAKMCKHYRLSLDYLVYKDSPSENPYAFLSDALYKQTNSYADFLFNMHNHLTQLSQFNRVKGTYLCAELPFFYYLQFPALLAFKLYVWDHVNLKVNRPDRMHEFDLTKILNEKGILSNAYNITEIYSSYPSIEIWNLNILTPIVDQLLYFKSLGLINDENYAALVKSMNSLILFLTKQLHQSKKLNKNNPQSGQEVEIYLNEVSYTNEIILIQSEEYNIVYNTFDVPNYLRSSDHRVCDYSKEVINKIIPYCVQINMTGLRDRTRIIRKLKEDVKSLNI